MREECAVSLKLKKYIFMIGIPLYEVMDEIP